MEWWNGAEAGLRANNASESAAGCLSAVTSSSNKLTITTLNQTLFKINQNTNNPVLTTETAVCQVWNTEPVNTKFGPLAKNSGNWKSTEAPATMETKNKIVVKTVMLLTWRSRLTNRSKAKPAALDNGKPCHIINNTVNKFHHEIPINTMIKDANIRAAVKKWNWLWLV